MEDANPIGMFDIAMAPKYWIAFFVGKFTAWDGTQGKKQHHFDCCMLKIISVNIQRFETSCLAQWKYCFDSVLKCHHFECNCCGALIKSGKCNPLDLSDLLATLIRMHMGIKTPPNNYVSHLSELKWT